MAAKKKEKGKKTRQRKMMKSKRGNKVLIEELPRSHLMDEELKDLESHEKETDTEEETRKTKIPKFYRKYAVKCMKCVKEFEHEPEMPRVEEEVECPECGETHTIEIIPLDGRYMITIPENLHIMEEDEDEE